MGGASLDEFLNCIVVLDTRSPYVYIGTLENHDDMFITLRDAMVHDCTESPITREQYVTEVKKLGPRVSRKRIKVKNAEIISLSRLDDVVAA